MSCESALQLLLPDGRSRRVWAELENGTLKCYYDDCEFYGSDFHEFYDSGEEYFHEFYDSEFFSDSAYSEGEFGDCG